MGTHLIRKVKIATIIFSDPGSVLHEGQPAE